MVAEWRGYGKLYYYPSEFYGVWGMLLSVAAFIVWTDFAIYWIHRWLHTFPTLYKYIHKEHHVWVIPTPWAAIAFHPLDGWAQEIPYLLFPFFFPLQKHLYLALYIFILSWTCSIHDRINLTEHPFINTAAHHDVSGACCFTKKENGFFFNIFFPPSPKKQKQIHHRKYNFNYGQYFTLWDRVGKSHLSPDLHGGDKDAIPPGEELKKRK